MERLHRLAVLPLVALWVVGPCAAADVCSAAAMELAVCCCGMPMEGHGDGSHGECPAAAEEGGSLPVVPTQAGAQPAPTSSVFQGAPSVPLPPLPPASDELVSSGAVTGPTDPLYLSHCAWLR